MRPKKVHAVICIVAAAVLIDPVGPVPMLWKRISAATIGAPMMRHMLSKSAGAVSDVTTLDTKQLLRKVGAVAKETAQRNDAVEM